MNIITEALNWFEQKRKQRVIEYLQFRHANGTANIRASVIDPQQIQAEQGIQTKGDNFLFIVERVLLTNIDVAPNCLFIREDGSTYRVVRSLNTQDYNDSQRKSVVIPAQEVK